MPAVAVRACVLVIDASTDTECRAIALVAANGQQRIIEAKRVWTDVAVMLALQEAAGRYGVPIALERVVAAQPVQVIGQVRPGRRSFKRREIGQRTGIDKAKVPRVDTSPEPLDPKTETRERVKNERSVVS